MEQLTIHACGHEQVHYLTDFASQQQRKARWLPTTKCRTCLAAEKQAEQVEAAARDGAAIAHLDLPPLVGSERQVAWASAIRAGRLAVIMATAKTGVGDHQACLLITEAKWWIDHRALTNTELLMKAELFASAAAATFTGSVIAGVVQAA